MIVNRVKVRALELELDQALDDWHSTQDKVGPIRLNIRQRWDKLLSIAAQLTKAKQGEEKP